ncbi:MAG TPA: ROK family transcriptional regulator [Tepidisphaeraceae bacterium]|nr:ROK family transcriptional regulator [Tepidisphaeraceae bacterium]
MAGKAKPALLRQLNDRAVFELLLDHGQASRAELTRHMGVSPTTASKTVARLLRAGFLEEVGTAAATKAGRPGRIYRLGSGSAQVLGAAIDVRRSCVLAAGLDGRIHPEHVYDFPTPRSYDRLVEALTERAQHLMQTRNMPTLGMGISVPGGIDYRRQRVLLSPNLHMTDGHSPSADLSGRLGIETVLAHEIRGACLAERAYGVARGMDNFVMVWAYAGFGAAAVTGGRVLQGHDLMAGELGHITVERNGIECGCGNRGCLETVATDAAFARRVSDRVGRTMEIEEIRQATREGRLDPTAELNETLDYLAIGIAAAINIFNPEAVLVCASSLDVQPDALDRLKQRVEARTLRPLLRNCRVLRAKGDTRQGAVASIIHHLTHALGPEMA